MEKNYVKGILATVQNDGADLTDFKATVLDVNDQVVLAKALCCVVPNEYRYVIDGMECHIYADDSGVHDENAVATMIVKADGYVVHAIIKNLFICKVVNGQDVSFSDEEQAIILGKLRLQHFGYFPTLYLDIKL